jgi:hypothetical protein
MHTLVFCPFFFIRALKIELGGIGKQFNSWCRCMKYLLPHFACLSWSTNFLEIIATCYNVSYRGKYIVGLGVLSRVINYIFPTAIILGTCFTCADRIWENANKTNANFLYQIVLAIFQCIGSGQEFMGRKTSIYQILCEIKSRNTL